jgi:hypothetical protein
MKHALILCKFRLLVVHKALQINTTWLHRCLDLFNLMVQCNQVLAAAYLGFLDILYSLRP